VSTFLKISLDKVSEELKQLEITRNKEIEKQQKALVNKLLIELKDKTPVDTGHARDSWSLEKSKEGFLIENSTDYIQYLNQGSSKQAPKYFIENTAINYGKPVGQIVEIDHIYNTRD